MDMVMIDNMNDGYYEWADYYTEKTLDAKQGKDCLKINNDQVYDSISRSDEQKVPINQE